MNSFPFPEFMDWINALSEHRSRLHCDSRGGNGGVALDDLERGLVRDQIARFSVFFHENHMEECWKICSQYVGMFGSPSVLDRSGAKAYLDGLIAALQREFQKISILRVDESLSALIDSDDNFGMDVTAAFPSAAADIREAGNCLACDCNTAAVFHLVRSAEIALRALAIDRGVFYPHSSVDEQQCGALVTSLDAKLNALRGADKRLWPSESIKNEQIRFYHAATIEFRSFNEAWRRQVCHAGSVSFYDRHQALSIFEHIKRFMQLLAPKVSENSPTPEYWASL